MADRSSDWLEQARRDLEQAERSMQAGRHEWVCFAAHQAVDKALKELNLACDQQGWGHTLSRLWTDLPEQPWQPEPPADLQDRLWLFDGLSIATHRPRQRLGNHAGRASLQSARLAQGSSSDSSRSGSLAGRALGSCWIWALIESLAGLCLEHRQAGRIHGKQQGGDQQAPAPQPSRGSGLESQNGFSHQWQERRPTNKKAPTKQGQTNKCRVTSSPG